MSIPVHPKVNPGMPLFRRQPLHDVASPMSRHK